LGNQKLSSSFERIKHFDQAKLSANFVSKSHIYIGLWWPFKIQMKRCDCWEYFLKPLLVIDYHIGVIDYTVTFEELWLFTLKFEFLRLVIDYQYIIIDYITLKFKFKFLMTVLKRFKSLVIDYKPCIIITCFLKHLKPLKAFQKTFWPLVIDYRL